MTAHLYNAENTRPPIIQEHSSVTLQHTPGCRPCPSAPTPSFRARKASYSAALYGYTLSQVVNDVTKDDSERSDGSGESASSLGRSL